jgi:hypothetical protein
MVMIKKIKFSLFLTLVMLFAFGCSSDFGVSSSSKELWLKENIKSPLMGESLSFVVKNYLTRENLLNHYRENPKEMLKELDLSYKESHDKMALLALIELSYFEGEKHNEMEALSYFFSCVVYSALYLKEPNSNPYSVYFIAACRYYNYASAEIIKIISKEKLSLEKSWDMHIIPGRVTIQPAKSELPRPLTAYKTFLSCFDFRQFGFLSYSRSPGLGVPLIAVSKKEERNKRVSEKLKGVFELTSSPYPATLFLQVSLKKSNKYKFSITPEFHDPYLGNELTINGAKAAMEIDLTTPLAYMANKGASYSGITAMQNFNKMGINEGLYLLTPYDKNKIPVVLVHGLMSRPRTWIQLTNTLYDNKQIRERYQFWYFAYPTGLPIMFSAKKLRDSLNAAQLIFDPKKNNPYFNKMIVVSHSMGGLLAKTLVVDSGEKLVKDLFKMPIEDMDITQEQKKFLSDILIFKPLPFVTEIIFMATPHRGTSIVEWGIVRFANSFITLPKRMLVRISSFNKNLLAKIGVLDEDDLAAKLTGVSSLDPNSKTLASMVEMRIIVPYHSIIGDTKEAGRIGGSDGLVEYNSSHLNGATSELIIKSEHNVQKTADGIKEVRRILLEHLKTAPPIATTNSRRLKSE